MSKLTDRLIALAPAELAAATQHPFLIAAATSALPVQSLKDWLWQDRLYAYSYIHFISEFITKISVPTSELLGDSIEGKWTEMLIDCLVNIRREIMLFEQVAGDEGWVEEMLAVEANGPTNIYKNVFRDAVGPSKSLLYAMVTLWATEHCYYTAWSYAKTYADEHIPQNINREDLDVMQRIFIPNWTCEEFRVMVDLIGGLLNLYAEGLDWNESHWKDSQQAYRIVLAAETIFWPSVDTKTAF